MILAIDEDAGDLRTIDQAKERTDRGDEELRHAGRMPKEWQLRAPADLRDQTAIALDEAPATVAVVMLARGLGNAGEVGFEEALGVRGEDRARGGGDAIGDEAFEGLVVAIGVDANIGSGGGVHEVSPVKKRWIGQSTCWIRTNNPRLVMPMLCR